MIEDFAAVILTSNVNMATAYLRKIPAIAVTGSNSMFLGPDKGFPRVTPTTTAVTKPPATIHKLLF